MACAGVFGQGAFSAGKVKGPLSEAWQGQARGCCWERRNVPCCLEGGKGDCFFELQLLLLRVKLGQGFAGVLSDGDDVATGAAQAGLRKRATLLLDSDCCC